MGTQDLEKALAEQRLADGLRACPSILGVTFPGKPKYWYHKRRACPSILGVTFPYLIDTNVIV